MNATEMEKRKSDPGRPKPPTAEQQQKLEELRQKLKDGLIKFPHFVDQAHLVLGD